VGPMAFFKKKPSDPAADQEFEQTIIAEEPVIAAPDTGAILADEPVPEPMPEPEPYMGEGAPEAPPTYPAEIEPYLRHEANRLVLVETNFDRPTKLNAEGKVTSAPRSALSEVAWHPKHRRSLKDIHSEVDKLKPHQPRLVGDWLKAFKVTSFLTPKRERVPQNILAKKIVYETEGGFVVEVTYRDGTETRKKFFTASSVDGRAKALGQIQSGKYAQVHVVDEQKIGEMRTTGTGHFATPPGKVNTFEITNKVDVLEVEGIGEIFARRLHELGVHTTDQLRLMNAQVIANNLGAPVGSVEKWQQMSELMLIEGIGKQSAESLVRAGITSIDALKKQTPKKLVAAVKLAKVGSRMRGIQSASARSWIQKARKMRKSLQPFPIVQA
jgi:predicted flap endonuclease-1-like 5' DNA nuclease